MKFPSTSKGTHLTLLIEFCLHIFLLFAHPSLAQTTSGAATAAPTATTTTPTATSDQSTTTTSTNVFSAIASAHPSNAGLYGVQPGSVGNDPTNQAGENNAGASGGDSSGSINLSTSVIVTIIVIATVVVIIGSTFPYSVVPPFPSRPSPCISRGPSSRGSGECALLSLRSTERKN